MKNRKKKIGKVIKNKCNKSITVMVSRKIKHPVYGKFIKKNKKFMANDKNNQYNIGDIVKIIETRPISKKKKWKVIEKIKKE